MQADFDAVKASADTEIEAVVARRKKAEQEQIDAQLKQLREQLDSESHASAEAAARKKVETEEAEAR